MTFEGDPVRTGNNVFKVLAVIAVIFVAYWAIRGGYEEIPVAELTTTTTVVETTTTSTPDTTTTSVPDTTSTSSTSTTSTTLPEE